MPIYEYVCPCCGYEISIMIKISEVSKIELTCWGCICKDKSHIRMIRKISRSTFKFKGGSPTK